MNPRTILLIFLLNACCNSVWPQSDFHGSVYPQQIIFDTDFGPDYDDVGAIAMLHAYADSGWVNILATMASSKHPHVAAALNVFNTYFNRAEIPIGVVGRNGVELSDKQHWTDSVTLHYPHSIKNNTDAYDALWLYRKILASQPDHSVTIITVGFLTNLANLLMSAPDSLSSLTGYDLVTKKVNLVISMAGGFPSGKEFNLTQDITSAQKVLSEWPTNILFSGFEIGRNIKTGIPLIHNRRIKNSPVKDVFAICIPLSAEDSAGRMSWDETTVLTAVKGWDAYYSLQTGRCTIHDNGLNEWISDGRKHAYLVQKMSPQTVTDLINGVIMHEPVKIYP